MKTRTIQILSAALVVAAIPVTYAIAQSAGSVKPPISGADPAVAQGPVRPGVQPGQGGAVQPGGGGFQNPQPYGGFNQGPPMMGGGGGGGTAMVADGQFLFIVSGGMVYKVDKGSLNVVGRQPLNPPMMPAGGGPARVGGGGGGE